MMYVLFFILGTVFGSFYNVLIYRLPENLSIISPPSMCPRCGSKISLRDNIPIISYFLLGGKCRDCKGSISLRYPLVEFGAGLIFLVSYHFDALSLMLLRDLVFYSVLFIITFIDMDKRIIPDVLSVGGAAAGFLIEGLLLKKGLKFPLIGVLTGGGILFLTAAGYELLTKREGLGGGDVKLLAAIGAFTGYMGAIFTIFLGSMVGTFFGLIIMIRERGNLRTAIPFGPFLAAGAVVADIILRNYTITF
jgi:leader peptidase (prepilin peptidase)/N-methyltransferase